MARPRKEPVRVPTVAVTPYYPKGRDQPPRYEAFITVTMPNGEPKRLHRRGADVEEVAAKIFEIEDRVIAKTAPATGKRHTVKTWFVHWLTEIATVTGRGGKPLDEGTIYSYMNMCDTWLFKHCGGILLESLTSDDLDRLYSAMKQAKLAKSSILRMHAITRRGLEVALRRDKVIRNVAASMDNPGSTEVRRKKVPTTEQARRIVDVIGTRRNALRWKIGLATGARQGEALGLRWAFWDKDEASIDIAWQVKRRTWRHGCGDHAEQVECARKHCRGKCTQPPGWAHGCDDPAECKGTGRSKGKALKIPKPVYCPNRKPDGACMRHPKTCPQPCKAGCTKHANRCPHRAGGGLQFARPKTVAIEDPVTGVVEAEEATHLVALPLSLNKELGEHRKRQDAEAEFLGDEWEENDLIFCNQFGKPIDPHADWVEWRAILTEAGVPKAGTHLMRHIAATMLIDLGVALEIVQQVLGHTDIRTTRRYAQVTKKLTERAATAMDEALFSPRSAPRVLPRAGKKDRHLRAV